MDPQVEQRLRDEVIYLHSLWHQGPPRTTTNSAIWNHLDPSKTTLFKKESKCGGKKKKKGKDKANTSAAAKLSSSHSTEWQCPTPLPQPSAKGWPDWETKADVKPKLLSPEEQLKLASRNAHQSAQKVVNEFFTSINGDDSDATDSDDDKDDELMMEDDRREYYSFFFKVFKESAELRECYKNNFGNGEFTCLVCGASRGKKTSKKYQGCLALIQHSITISKTKKRRAHRALGQAICKVLGWDIDQLPSIVSLLSDKSAEGKDGSVAVVVDNVDSVQDDKLESKDGEAAMVDNVDSVEDDKLAYKNNAAVLEGGSNDAGVLPNGDEENMISLTCPDAGKDLDDSTVHPHNMEIPASEELNSNSLSTCPDADWNTENFHATHPLNQKGLANASVMPDADQKSEVNPDSVEVPAEDGLTSLTPVEIPGVGNECKNGDQQLG